LPGIPWRGAFGAAVLMGMGAAPAMAAPAGKHAALGAQMPLVSVLPFATLLLAIAVLPLVCPHWWEKNRNKAIVVAILAVPLASYLALAWGEEGQHELLEKGEEYLSFMVLLGALFIISGGIYVQGSLSGTPLVNTGVLALGAVMANLIGTTGASVLLIRPLLRANAPRQRKAHLVIFFIFVVSNCAGLLTPLGDPPLFLGFLKGVPFEWTLGLWRQWLIVNGALLVVFHVWDQIALNREERERPGPQLEEVQRHEPLRVQGLVNFLFLAGVVAAIYASGRGLGNQGSPWPYGVQEGIMAGLALAAYALTPGENRTRNRFTFGPIVEVAVLFAGIFITMAPALVILNAWGQGQRQVLGAEFGLSLPWQFFWITGGLSSFLDNAPTYLTFAATACGLEGVAAEGRYLETFLNKGPDAVRLLAAISCGAVFMGANTYIGNGPNFMVKAIAEENGVPMPSFFGYMLYSGCILLPLFVVVTFLFFVPAAPWR
jgi:Na+/H+ antiporter NhaD/arsenite permease-like protein